jgi:hypothetical protein
MTNMTLLSSLAKNREHLRIYGNFVDLMTHLPLNIGIPRFHHFALHSTDAPLHPHVSLGKLPQTLFGQGLTSPSMEPQRPLTPSQRPEQICSKSGRENVASDCSNGEARNPKRPSATLSPLRSSLACLAYVESHVALRSFSRFRPRCGGG